MKENLSSVLAELIYARKEFQKMKFSRHNIRDLIEKIQTLMEDLEDSLAIGDLKTHPHTYDYLDKGFLKICEAAVYIHRVKAILEEEKQKRSKRKAFRNEE